MPGIKLPPLDDVSPLSQSRNKLSEQLQQRLVGQSPAELIEQTKIKGASGLIEIAGSSKTRGRSSMLVN